MSEVRWVALAEVTRPHGVAGELRVRLYNADSALLVSRRKVLMREAAGAERMMAVESMRGADAGYLLAKLEGIDDRDQAEELRGAVFCVARSEFAPLDEGEFYICDVVGAKLLGPNGPLGTVEGIASYPTADVLVVRLDKGQQGDRVELPLVDDFVDRIDVERKLVVVHSAALELLEPAGQ